MPALLGERIPVRFFVLLDPFRKPDQLPRLGRNVMGILIRHDLFGLGTGQTIPLLACHLTSAAR